jgi:hypothetical protein
LLAFTGESFIGFIPEASSLNNQFFSRKKCRLIIRSLYKQNPVFYETGFIFNGGFAGYLQSFVIVVGIADI